MGNTDAKSAHELAVFREFQAAVLAGEGAVMAEPCDPPRPDIYFPSPRQPRYFELGRLADPVAAATALQAQRQAPDPVTPDLRRTKLPEREVLAKKLRKNYETAGLPVELLLYFDSEPRHLQGGIPLMPFPEHAHHVMVPLLQQSSGPYVAVWVFERYMGSVLWLYRP